MSVQKTFMLSHQILCFYMFNVSSQISTFVKCRLNFFYLKMVRYQKNPGTASIRRFCSRCRNHGLKLNVRGHKRVCLYADCHCNECQLQIIANSASLKERKMQRKCDEKTKPIKKGRKRLKNLWFFKFKLNHFLRSENCEKENIKDLLIDEQVTSTSTENLETSSNDFETIISLIYFNYRKIIEECLQSEIEENFAS